MNLFEALRSDTDDREADHVFHVPYDLPPTIYNTKTGKTTYWAGHIDLFVYMIISIINL